MFEVSNCPAVRWAGLATLCIGLGCSAEAPSGGRGTRDGTGSANDFGNATKTPAGGGGASGSFSNSSDTTGSAPPTTAGGGGRNNMQIGEGEECNADSYQAEGRQLDIYMVVDDSGSMVPWWPGTLDAINMFFNDPGSAGIGVGVQFFGSACEPAAYATPRVGIAPLPGNTGALQAAFPLLPIEGTATVPAMQGAIMHAQQWATDHPDSKTVVLLVTDGLPDDCGSTVPGVVQAAADGLAGSPSIQTFVIGIGIGLDALNMFAQAGGTDQALLVEPGAAQALVSALNEIRGAALPCDYKLPDGAAGDVASDTVNMRYTTPGGDMTTIGWVPDASACDATQGGWYYDNPSAPTRLVACDTSCNQLKEQGGEVQVVLGCPRVVIVPE